MILRRLSGETGLVGHPDRQPMRGTVSVRSICTDLTYRPAAVAVLGERPLLETFAGQGPLYLFL